MRMLALEFILRYGQGTTSNRAHGDASPARGLFDRLRVVDQ